MGRSDGEYKKPIKAVVICSTKGIVGRAFLESYYVEKSPDPWHSCKADAMEFMYETYGNVPYTINQHHTTTLVIPQIGTKQ